MRPLKLSVLAALLTMSGCRERRAEPPPPVVDASVATSPRERVLALRKEGWRHCRAAAKARSEQCEKACGEEPRADDVVDVASGAWVIVPDDAPCPPGQPHLAKWHLARATVNELLTSPVYETDAWPHLAFADEAIVLDYAQCIASSDRTFCMTEARHTCAPRVDGGALTRGCLDVKMLTPPAWLPAYVQFPPAPGSTAWTDADPWTLGSTAVRRRGNVELEAMPMRFSDGDVTQYALAGPVLQGRVGPDGAIAFDAPDLVAADRTACSAVPDLSKAESQDLWRSALCRRLEGRSTAAITKQWEQRCAQPRKDAGGTDLLTFACGAYAHDRNFGTDTKQAPKVVVQYLDRVKPWPSP